MQNSKNIAIQFEDELTMFYTTSIERAKEVATHTGLKFSDVYEVRDDEMEHYYFDGRCWDNGNALVSKEVA